MKEIRPFMYDSTGLCPKCGKRLLSVTYYSASELGTSVRREYPDSFHKQRITTTSYGNIKPCSAGWCMDCARKDHEEKEELAAKTKKPVMILPIIGVLLMGGGIYSLIQSGGYGTVAGIGFLASFVGAPLFIISLVSYIKKAKRFNKYRSGYREPFNEPSADTLSAYAARAMSKAPHPNGTVYLSAGQVDDMRRQG